MFAFFGMVSRSMPLDAARCRSMPMPFDADDP